MSTSGCPNNEAKYCKKKLKKSTLYKSFTSDIYVKMRVDLL